jgi:hypothetical protein
MMATKKVVERFQRVQLRKALQLKISPALAAKKAAQVEFGEAWQRRHPPVIPAKAGTQLKEEEA